MINSVEQFIQLRTSQNPIEYNRAANDEMPTHVWDDLIKIPEMREWAIYNKTVPVRVLEILAKDEDPRVRSAIVVKNKATPELLKALVNDPDDFVRCTARMKLEILASSKPLTFGELKVGDKFIALPLDGDDKGHGGFRGDHYLFMKVVLETSDKNPDNALRLVDGNYSAMPKGMQIIKIVS